MGRFQVSRVARHSGPTVLGRTGTLWQGGKKRADRSAFALSVRLSCCLSIFLKLLKCYFSSLFTVSSEGKVFTWGSCHIETQKWRISLQADWTRRACAPPAVCETDRYECLGWYVTVTLGIVGKLPGLSSEDRTRISAYRWTVTREPKQLKNWDCM